MEFGCYVEHKAEGSIKRVCSIGCGNFVNFEASHVNFPTESEKLDKPASFAIPQRGGNKKRFRHKKNRPTRSIYLSQSREREM